MSLKLITYEAIAALRSQPVSSIMTLFVVAGMFLAVMLTSGRTAGTEQQLMSAIDKIESRTVIIHISEDAQASTEVLLKINRLYGVEWAGGFSSASDGKNQKLDSGTLVPVREFVSTNPGWLGIPKAPFEPEAPVAYISDEALNQFGMLFPAGSIVTSTDSVTIAGRLVTNEALSKVEPLALIPKTFEDFKSPLSTIVLVVESPRLLVPITETAISFVSVDDPAQVTASTSKTLAAVRDLVEERFSSLTKILTIGALVILGLVVGTVVFALILFRRKDFGRRRALGATRSWIVRLILIQTGLLAILGCSVGCVISFAILLFEGSPAPSAAFTLSLGYLTIFTSLLAAVLPAYAASKREPIKELRIP